MRKFKVNFMDLSKIRGFNVHGDWGGHGITEWLNFDSERYKMMISKAKERFPGMNTARIWLSFDAYLADRTKYLENIKKAVTILTEAGLKIIPVYYNGWFGMPCYGSFTAENILSHQLPIYVRCTKETTLAIKDADILMYDISNEPLNNVYGNIDAFNRVVNFLELMINTVREIDSKPITIGTQGYPAPHTPELCDIDRLMPLVDIFSLHPYNNFDLSREDFEKQFKEVIDYVEAFNKPYLITECVWGAPTAEGRKKYLEIELETYSKYKVGFLCHALFTCPVADLFPVEEIDCSEGLYMAFLDREFNIRPYHDIFNKL